MAPPAAQSVFVLAGKDSFLRQEARHRILDELLGDADRQLCQSVFDSSVDLAMVLDELRTLPFLAPHRVVVVREAESFVSAHRDALEAYFDKPAPAGTLVLEVASWPGNTRLAKKLKTVGQCIACSSPEGRDLIDWIQQTARKLGKPIVPQAANLLADFIGQDLAALQNELEKLITYVGEAPQIEPQDVTTIVTAGGAPEAFAVTNAITNGDVKAALTSLSQAMTTRGAEFALLGQLAWHLRRALQVSQAMADGQSPGMAMKAARVFYGQREFQDMIRRRSIGKLQQDFRRLIAADLGLKTGQDARATMQQLVLSLCT